MPNRVRISPAASGVTLTVEEGGPFFEKDPTQTYRQNVRHAMDAIAQWGQSAVRGRIGGRGTGRTKAAFTGRTASLSGRRWAVTAVVSPVTSGRDAAQARSIMAAAHEIEYGHKAHRQVIGRRVGQHVGNGEPLGRGHGQHVVRDTARDLKRFTPQLYDELMKGIAE